MASDDSFSTDERAVAGIEMQRCFENVTSGPTGVAQVTGNFTVLYKAAAQYLDGLGAEEKAGANWIVGRAAITEGFKQLQSDPKTPPDTRDQDPVQLYLALVYAGEALAAAEDRRRRNQRPQIAGHALCRCHRQRQSTHIQQADDCGHLYRHVRPSQSDPVGY
ncbi:MAG: hypothetical protein MO852_03705 [Candidatus Devosia euplotis]|nr:hypothetical protein [Candidatus Devosia euplotis]